MKKSTKIILWSILILIVILVVIIVFYKKPTQNSKETIKVGVLVPLTKFGDLGEKMKRGADLAKDEINNDGGIDGKNLEFIYGDTQCDSETALTEIKKMVEVDNINVIVGPLCSSAVLSIAPYAEQSKVLIMNGGIALKIKKSGEYIFRPIPGVDIIASQHANFVLNKLSIITTASLFQNNDFGMSYSEAFKDEYVKNGGEIVISENFNQGDTDFRTQILKIKKSGAKAILIAGSPNEMGLVAKQIKEQGLDVQLLLPTSAESPDLITAGGDALEGAIYTYGYNSNATDGVQYEFIKNYKKIYDEDVSWHAALGYDAVKLYSLAMKNCETKETSCIRDSLYLLKYDGAQGSIKFDDYGDALLPITFKTIKNGQFVPYEE